MVYLSESLTSPAHPLWKRETAAEPRVISMTKDAVADTLDRLCRWHRRLCDLVDMVTSCYELPLFVVIVYCFANSVFGAYKIITSPKHERLMTVTNIIWSVAYGCRLVVIAVIPSVTVAEVSRSAAVSYPLLVRKFSTISAP
jgi:hypothetical protein